MSKKVTNTPVSERMEWSLGGLAPEAIEAQEAQGQAERVAAEVLPTKGLEAVASATGIKIEGPVDGDPLFTSVALPAGWSKRRTDHALWSDLVDDKGRKRAAIFYKAAFYDRRAEIHATTRFKVKINYDTAEMWVEDCGKTVFASVVHPCENENWEARETAENKARAECVMWLTAQGFADWQNPAAYWT